MDETFMFKREEIADPFWKIFMAHELDKVNKRPLKSELFEYGMKSLEINDPFGKSLWHVNWIR
jgi:hypothetical protein